MLFEKGAFARSVKGDLPKARQFFLAAERGFDQLGLTNHLGEPLINRQALAELDMLDWNFARADEMFLKGEEAARIGQLSLARAQVDNMYGLSLAQQGKHEEARDRFRRARVGYAQTLPPTAGVLRINRARFLYNEALSGNAHDIVGEFESIKALPGARHAGTLFGEAFFTAARSLFLIGQWQRYLDESAALVEEKQGPQRKLQLLLDRAHAFTMIGQQKASQEMLNQASAIVAEHGSALPQPMIAIHALVQLRAHIANRASSDLVNAARTRFSQARSALKGESVEFQRLAAGV
jgi:tetratricopeptide (TPR) repeat protein